MNVSASRSHGVHRALIAATLVAVATGLIAACSSSGAGPAPGARVAPGILDRLLGPPTSTPTPTPRPTSTPTMTPTATATPTATPTPLHPLSIEAMRLAAYPGSDIVMERELQAGRNYQRRVVSYDSEGQKQFALLTVPNGDPPPGGWPAIVFNHGYIPPSQYRTTERYVSYVDGFARNGYVVLKPDYRGHGDSEGEATGGYGSPAYTVDVLNALSSLARLPEVDPDRMGMWGHSMGGSITMRAMVTVPNIRAGVIWAGVVASYPDLISQWGRHRATARPEVERRSRWGGWRQDMQQTYGAPEDNPAFWASISATSYLEEISGPVQLHHGTADTSVPYSFSADLARRMQALGRPVEYFEYPGDDHNLSSSFGTAMARSIAFFDEHVKGR